MVMEGFRRNVVGPPEWEYEAMGSVVWVQCATFAECINLSIVIEARVSRSFDEMITIDLVEPTLTIRLRTCEDVAP